MDKLSSILTQSEWITINKKFAKIYGLHEAILISELGWRYEYYRNMGKLEDGYFFSDYKKIEENTTLSYYHQKKAQNKLIKIGVLSVRKRRSIPPRLEHKVDIQKLNKIVFNLCKQ